MTPMSNFYDENDPAPYVNYRISLAFDAARYTVTSIERADETTTVHARDRDDVLHTFDCEPVSDDDGTMTFDDITDRCPSVLVVLFPTDE